MKMKKTLIIILQLTIILVVLNACNQTNKIEKPEKSLLVNNLEGIFYNDSFTTIPNKVFNTKDDILFIYRNGKWDFNST